MRKIAQPIYDGGTYRKLWCNKLGRPNQLSKLDTQEWAGI